MGGAVESDTEWRNSKLVGLRCKVLKGFWREHDNIFRRGFSSYIRWSWILGDHLAHRKAINGASIRMETSRDQRFFCFVHKFLVFKFLSQVCSHLILQQVILAHFLDEKMEIQVSTNGCYCLAIGAIVWPLVLVFGLNLQLHGTWYKTQHPWSSGFTWTHIYSRSQEQTLEISLRELHLKQQKEIQVHSGNRKWMELITRRKGTS